METRLRIHPTTGGDMELHRLTSRDERAEFSRKLEEARTTRGAGFRETKRSVLGEVHLAFGDLYAVYDESSQQPRDMLAGFIIHSLDQFPLTYPCLEMNALEPSRVFEGGELWSFRKGAGTVARVGASVVLGFRRALAMVVFPIVKPWDLSKAYPTFRKVGEEFVWPFAETVDGEKIISQALVLDGPALEKSLALAFKMDLEIADDGSTIRIRGGLNERVAASRPRDD